MPIRIGSRVSINANSSARSLYGRLGTVVIDEYPNGRETMLPRWRVRFDGESDYNRQYTFRTNSLNEIDVAASTDGPARPPGEFRVGDRVRVSSRNLRGREWAGREGVVESIEDSSVTGSRSTIKISFTDGGHSLSYGMWMPGSLDLIESADEPVSITAPTVPAQPPLRRTREEVTARLEQYRSAPASGLSRLAIEELEWILS